MALSNDNVANSRNSFREAVCINTKRIYDSCGDKDCIKDLQVMFTSCGQQVIDCAMTIKVRSAEAIGVFFEVEPLAFNKGFYSVDMTFFFKVTVAVYSAPASSPCLVEGLATFSKKVILFGSDASVKTFSTDSDTFAGSANIPIVNVQVVDPLILSFKVCDIDECCIQPQCYSIPEKIADQFDGCFEKVCPARTVLISLGMFSIVQLERQVQIMVPIYDFCIPNKECTTNVSTQNPCDLFEKIDFPTDEFFPPRLSDMQG